MTAETIPDEKKQPKSQADRLVEYGLSQAYLFFDQYKVAYARVTMRSNNDINGTNGTNDTSHSSLPSSNIKNSKEEEEDRTYKNRENIVNAVSTVSQPHKTRLVIMPLRNPKFKEWLSTQMWQKEQKAPSQDALGSAINVLVGKAFNEGKKYTLYNRVAPALDGIWIDMADDDWRAIHVTAKGWEIVDNPPILFKRYNHQEPLVEPLPKEQGDAWRILKYVNLNKNDTNSQLMFLCCHISYFIPSIAHPSIVASGGAGAAKSCFFRLIQKISDPSSSELLTLPKDERQLAQQLEHHWIAPFDNISYLPAWASDTLCRAVTGGGIEVRKLYTDDEDVIFKFKRCVLLNGINLAARRSDLLDRNIIFTLEAIPKEERKTDSALNTAFNNDQAPILTGYLNVLSQALKIYPEIKLTSYQRLADFNLYGCAIAQALGKTWEDFTAAYEEKVEFQNEEALNASPIAVVLLSYFGKEHGYWLKNEGSEKHCTVSYTPAELYDVLTEFVEKEGMKTKDWAKEPNVFMRKINEIKSNLASLGCYIEESHNGVERKVTIDVTEYVQKRDKKSPVANFGDSDLLNLFNGGKNGISLPECDKKTVDTPDSSNNNSMKESEDSGDTNSTPVKQDKHGKSSEDLWKEIEQSAGTNSADVGGSA